MEKVKLPTQEAWLHPSVFICFPQCMQSHQLDFQTYLESNHSPSMTNILFQGIVIFYQIMAIALSLHF